MFFTANDTTFLAEVREVIPASKALDRQKIWPFIDQAERKYIYPLLGKELYDDLQKFLNDRDNWSGGSGEDEERTTALLKLIRIAELNLAYFSGYDFLNLTNSASGFQRPADGEAFKNLYKYQEENLKKYFEQTGYNGLDEMLSYIEENIEYFPEWEESDTYLERKVSIIKDAVMFNGICFINKSRLTFLRLQPYMKEVMDLIIEPALGTEYTLLMIELAKESPDPKYQALAAKIREPLAYLSVERLIIQTGSLTDRGLFFEGKNSIFPDDTTSQMASGDSAKIMAQSYHETGMQYLAGVIKYMADNEFTGSGNTTGRVYDYDNTDKKIFVA